MPILRNLANLWIACAAPLVLFTSACTTFHMSEQVTPAALERHRRASEESALVLPFRFTPANPDHRKDMSEQDLLRWQEFLAQSLDQTGIFERVSAATSPDAAREAARYAISGEIREFQFRKNWVPTFFPVHLAASFFTFTLFTWLGGPTTITDVDFDATVEVKDLRTGVETGTFLVRFESTDLMNLYTSSLKNPYDNPGLVWSQLIGRLAVQIAAALPAEPPTQPAMSPAPAARPGQAPL